jgi:hypothetical protein
MNIYTWDYKIPAKYNKTNDSEFQNDWNQTLMTTLNIIIYHENILDIDTITCLTPLKFKSLIESLTFYDVKTSTYKNLKFEFTQSDNDIIKINNNIELKILNYNE